MAFQKSNLYDLDFRKGGLTLCLINALFVIKQVCMEIQEVILIKLIEGFLNLTYKI
jgi:hypothetical protein